MPALTPDDDDSAGTHHHCVSVFLDVVRRMCDITLAMRPPSRGREDWKVTAQIVDALAPFAGAEGDWVRYAVGHCTHKRDPVGYLYAAAHAYKR